MRAKFINEQLNLDNLSISAFLYKIDIYDKDIVEWWDKNIGDNIKIYYFPFNTNQPMIGGMIGNNSIAFNSNIMLPSKLKLYVLLHEIAHIHQHSNNNFMDGYFNSVVENNEEKFLYSYKLLEKEANDFAINSMIELGFKDFIDKEELRLRANEYSGKMIYNMMKLDIKKYDPIDFFDLILKQII
jgi:Zn-dependent peptidase ImmA (M78 family)